MTLLPRLLKRLSNSVYSVSMQQSLSRLYSCHISQIFCRAPITAFFFLMSSQDTRSSWDTTVHDGGPSSCRMFKREKQLHSCTLSRRAPIIAITERVGIHTVHLAPLKRVPLNTFLIETFVLIFLPKNLAQPPLLILTSCFGTF